MPQLFKVWPSLKVLWKRENLWYVWEKTSNPTCLYDNCNQERRMSTNADGATDSDKSREGKMDRHHMKEHPVVMQNIEDTHISSNITMLESSEPGGKVLVYSLLDREWHNLYPGRNWQQQWHSEERTGSWLPTRILLNWFKGCTLVHKYKARRFHVFEANWVERIKQSTESAQWRNVASEEVPSVHSRSYSWATCSFKLVEGPRPSLAETTK